MIDEAWRAVHDATFRTGARDGTIPGGLGVLIAVLAVAVLASTIDLLVRRLARRKWWHCPTSPSTAALQRKLIRPSATGAPKIGLPEGR